MRKLLGLGVAGALGLAASGQAAVMQLQFLDGSDAVTGTATIGGTTWNTMVEKSNGAPFPNIADLRDSANALAGVGLSWSNGFHFASTGRGEGGNTSPTGVTYDGRFFPWAVVDSYNATHAGSDGYAAFTFTSDAPLSYRFWIIASFDNNNPGETAGWNGLYNVGGTYTLATRSFTGGTTLALNGTKQQGPDDIADSTGDTTLKYEVGRLDNAGVGFASVWDSGLSKYVLQLQFGDASSSTGAGVLANGIIVEAIPEPAGLALLGLAAVMLRRRR